MDFQIDEMKSILLATVECRGFYRGGITFIEYDNNLNTLELALNDFLDTKDTVRYIFCDDTDLPNIARLKHNQYLNIYVR